MCRMSSISQCGVPQLHLFQLVTMTPLAVGVAQICECNNCKLQCVMKY